jgi:hypothetical protein
MWSKLEISATRTLWKENDDRKTAQEKHVIQRKSEARTKSEARAYKPMARSFPRNNRGETQVVGIARKRIWMEQVQ